MSAAQMFVAVDAKRPNGVVYGTGQDEEEAIQCARRFATDAADSDFRVLPVTPRLARYLLAHAGQLPVALPEEWAAEIRAAISKARGES